MENFTLTKKQMRFKAMMHPNKIRISPSALDGFDFYLHNDYLNTPAYLNRVCGLEPPSMNLFAGEAVHKWLEFHQTHGLNGPVEVKRNGHDTETFEISHHKVNMEIPDCTFKEIKFEKEYPDYIIAGKMDAYDGITGYDWKTTSKSINLESYAESWQWKIYMLLNPDMVNFEYRIFQIKILNHPSGQDNWHMIDIRGAKSLRLNRYDLKYETLSMLDKYHKFLIDCEMKGWIERKKDPYFRWVPGSQFGKLMEDYNEVNQ